MVGMDPKYPLERVKETGVESLGHQRITMHFSEILVKHDGGEGMVDQRLVERSEDDTLLSIAEFLRNVVGKFSTSGVVSWVLHGFGR